MSSNVDRHSRVDILAIFALVCALLTFIFNVLTRIEVALIDRKVGVEKINNCQMSSLHHCIIDVCLFNPLFADGFVNPFILQNPSKANL